MHYLQQSLLEKERSININKLECKLKIQMGGQELVISININKLECKF